MRAILLVLILAVVALIAAIATGWLEIDQTRSAKAPDIDAGREGVSASGGQTPAFDIETGSVSVSTDRRNVTLPVPKVDVRPPGEEATANTSVEEAAEPPAAE